MKVRTGCWLALAGSLAIASLAAFPGVGNAFAAPVLSQTLRKAPPPRCAGLRVSSIQTSRSSKRDKARARRPVFSATEMLDLEFQVLLPRRLKGRHRIDLKIYTPYGHLYQTLTVPFTAERGNALRRRGATPKRRIEGYPHPVREANVSSVRSRGRRFHMVSAGLPVAGTSIVNNSLYGLWKVEAYLDGSLEPCCRARSFEITE